MHGYGDQRSTLVVILYLILWDSLTLVLAHAEFARLTVHWAPGLYPPPLGLQRQATVHSFLKGAGVLNSGVHVQQALYQLSHLSSSRFILKLNSLREVILRYLCCMTNFSWGDATHVSSPQIGSTRQTKVQLSPKSSLMNQWVLLQLLSWTCWTEV